MAKVWVMPKEPAKVRKVVDADGRVWTRDNPKSEGQTVFFWRTPGMKIKRWAGLLASSDWLMEVKDDE